MLTPTQPLRKAHRRFARTRWRHRWPQREPHHAKSQRCASQSCPDELSGTQCPLERGELDMHQAIRQDDPGVRSNGR